MYRYLVVVTFCFFSLLALGDDREMVKLPLSKVEVDATEIFNLVKMNVNDAVEYLRKEKKIRVVVLSKLPAPSAKRNPDLKTDPADDVGVKYFDPVAFSGQAQGDLEASYMPVNEDGLARLSKDGKDRGKRPFRDEPMIVITGCANTNTVVHEYMHHLIYAGSKRSQDVKGVKLSFRQITFDLKMRLRSEQETYQKAIDAAVALNDLGAYTKQVNTKVTDVISLAHFDSYAAYLTIMEEMDITRFFVEHSVEMGLKRDEIRDNLSYYRTAFTTGLSLNEKAFKLIDTLLQGKDVLLVIDENTKAAAQKFQNSSNFILKFYERSLLWFDQYLIDHPQLAKE